MKNAHPSKLFSPVIDVTIVGIIDSFKQFLCAPDTSHILSLVILIWFRSRGIIDQECDSETLHRCRSNSSSKRNLMSDLVIQNGGSLALAHRL